MSPSRKSDRPRRTRRTHAARRHRPGSASSSNPPPAVEVTAIPIKFDGRSAGELLVIPGTDQEVVARAIDQLAAISAWSRLGAELASLGLDRLEIAARAALATVSAAGGSVSTEEEAAIAAWFRGIVEEALRRGRGHAGRAIWFIFAGDDRCDPYVNRPARCPVVEEPAPTIGCEPEPTPAEGADLAAHEQASSDFLYQLGAAADDYIRAVIAGATDDDVLELRKLMNADDAALDAVYRPFGASFAETDPAEHLECARHLLTRRHLSNTDACRAIEEWAFGSREAALDHALTPVFRVGVVAWLARVALRPEERAA